MKKQIKHKKIAAKQSKLFDKIKESAFIRSFKNAKKTGIVLGLDLLNIAAIVLLLLLFNVTLQAVLGQAAGLTSLGMDVQSFLNSEGEFTNDMSQAVDTFNSNVNLFVGELIGAVILLVLLIVLVTSALQGVSWSYLKKEKFTFKLFGKYFWITFIVFVFWVTIGALMFWTDNLVFLIIAGVLFLINVLWLNNIVFFLVSRDKKILETIGAGVGLYISKFWQYALSLLLVAVSALIVTWLLNLFLSDYLQFYELYFIVLLFFLSWAKILVYETTNDIGIEKSNSGKNTRRVH